MLYRVGTMKELWNLRHEFSFAVLGQLYLCTATLDDAYGADRIYLETGGYSLIAETTDDLTAIREIVDLDDRPYEWVEYLDKDYLSALYLLNDDYAIVVFMPIAIAPPILLSEMED